MKKVVLLLSLLTLVSCSSFFFYPSTTLINTPKAYNVEYQDIYITVNQDVTLHGWWLPVKKTPIQGTLLYLHGNAGNISHHFKNINWLPEQGFQVLTIDYRGYGQSTGNAGIPELIEDIEASINWLDSHLRTQKQQDLPRFLFGQSLGAALGGYVLAANPKSRDLFHAVVLDSGFLGFRRMAKDATARFWLTWPLQYTAPLTLPTAYDLIDVIDQLAPLPLLITHSINDKVVPFAHGKELYNKASPNKFFLEYSGKHVSLFENENNRTYFLNFLKTARSKN